MGGRDSTFGRHGFGFVASFSPRFLVIIATVGAVGVLFCLCWAGHWDEDRTEGTGGGEDGEEEGRKKKQAAGEGDLPVLGEVKLVNQTRSAVPHNHSQITYKDNQSVVCCQKYLFMVQKITIITEARRQIGSRQSQTLSATPTHDNHIRRSEDMDERLASFMPSGTNYQVLDVIGEGAYGIVWCVLRHLVAGIPVYRPCAVPPYTYPPRERSQSSESPPLITPCSA